MIDLRMTNARTTALYYIGFVGSLGAVASFSYAGFALALFVHVLVISLFSAVVHRYFCHRAYEANPTVMWLAAFLPVAYAYSSPAGWSALHSAHHAFADTDKDPHLKGWSGLFTANYRMPPLKFSLAGKWFHGPRHSFLHNNALGVALVWHLLLLAISVDAFLWVGMVPLFTLHFCGGLHRVLSHKSGQAQNRWYLEYICPVGGEWIHAEHHDDARKPVFSNHWYELDTGGLLVKLFSKK